MGNSLQEQLLKAGLVDEKRLKKAQAGKAPPKRGKKGAPPAPPSESARAAQQAISEKAARDRGLNERQRAKAERKALRAQIRQLIEQNRLPRDNAEIAYNFMEGGTVRKLHVTEAIRDQLVKDRLSIVRLDGRYDVVPPDIAEKIRARDPGCVVQRQPTESSTDDAYADHPIPDDLMW
jgi:hypothetical protein